MRYGDFCSQVERRERKPNYKNNLIATELISEYLKIVGKNELSCQTGDPIEDILYEYFSIKGTEEEEIFIKLLNSHNFNYSMSIHNAIYYLLATEKEHVNAVNPLFWPGVNSVAKSESQYILDTVLGSIEISQASEIFSSSPSSHIFNKILMGKCYERSYDFLRENRNYQAVLSYMPNFFYGGHYHAYLEKDGKVLDIASNAFYSSKESSDKILCGEVIKKLTYKQAKQKFETIKNTTSNINSQQKLLTLALYYDRRNQLK